MSVEDVGEASFEGASADGSRVFFTDTGRLTNEASDDQQKQDDAFTSGCAVTVSFAAGCNLYAFSCPAHCEDETQRGLVDVSGGDVSGLGSRVQGVVAIPPDGSDVFFVAKGVLTGANGAGGVPVPGGENLYVYRFGASGGSGSLSFIATLPESDSGLWSVGVGVANVSSDGRVLVFASHGGLTADVSREEGPAQVYRYDVGAGRLSRVSIGLAGFNDNGNGSVTDARIVSAVQGFEAHVGAGRSDPSMSDSGDLVFFESAAGLVPGALNNVHVTGNPGVLAENVYEWAADGVKPSSGAAACGEVNGCVSLISDGRDVNEGASTHGNTSAVQLLGVDGTGDNVFFWTADPLVGWDRDSQVDLYDARVGGGFPEPVETPVCVTLVECGRELELPPVFGPVGGGVFSGAGNALTGAEEAPERLPSGSVGVRVSPAKRLARALRACRRERGGVRRVCEARARKAYRAQLLAAGLTRCRKEHGRARARCEHQLRRRYGRVARGGHR